MKKLLLILFSGLLLTVQLSFKSVTGNEKIVEAIKRNIPSAKIIILPNAEHDVYRSNEAEVLTAIKTFLDGLHQRFY